MPTNAHAVPTGPQWVYEIKHDGFRFICRREGDHVRVFSRRGIDHSDRALAIAEALRALPVNSVTIDGEGVVCGPVGTACALVGKHGGTKPGGRWTPLHAR